MNLLISFDKINLRMYWTDLHQIFKIDDKSEIDLTIAQGSLLW